MFQGEEDNQEFLVESAVLCLGRCKAGRSVGGGKAVMAERCSWRQEDPNVQVDGEAVEVAEVEDTAEVKLMIL